MEAQAKFPTSTNIIFNFGNFALTKMKEYHACINLISGIEKKQESWINKVSVLFTELYLTNLCEQQKKDTGSQNFKLKEIIKYEKE